MHRFDLDDDKIFLEIDFLYAEHEIGFVMVGADGKSTNKNTRATTLRAEGL